VTAATSPGGHRDWEKAEQPAGPAAGPGRTGRDRGAGAERRTQGRRDGRVFYTSERARVGCGKPLRRKRPEVVSSCDRRWYWEAKEAERERTGGG
jgi:hypothetical protein